MTLRLSTLSLITTAVALVSVGINPQKASAQNTFPFEATYTAEITTTPLGENIFEATDIAVSSDAPYGLTNLFNRNYARLNPETGVFTYGPDPAIIGLEDLPFGTTTLSGDGSDKLFGTISGSSAIDFENLVGTGSSTITITDGAGRFSGAMGTLDVSETTVVSPNPEDPIDAEFLITGSFTVPETVPEASNTKTILGMGIIGAGLLIRQRRKKISRNVAKTNM